MTHTRAAAAFFLAATLGACAAKAPAPAAPAPEPDVAPAAAAGGSVGEATEPVMMAKAWLAGTLNLREGPSTKHRVVASLPAGTQIWIGRPNAEGWAQVYDPQEFAVGAVSSVAARGWIFTRTPRLRSQPPAAKTGRRG
jgi:uncharacterized protein YgiM (DUF1202 family)